MRERSHKKGEEYQSLVSSWIVGHSILGYNAELFGNAYDATSRAAKLGRKGFDFSLKLKEKGSAKKILYAECKYHSRFNSKINTDFIGFINDVYYALFEAENDERSESEFCFFSTIPPKYHQDFCRNALTLCTNNLNTKEDDELDHELVRMVVEKVHILILSNAIIGGE